MGESSSSMESHMASLNSCYLEQDLLRKRTGRQDNLRRETGQNLSSSFAFGIFRHLSALEERSNNIKYICPAAKMCIPISGFSGW